MSWSWRTLTPAFLALTVALSSTPAWADFAAGRAAYEIGDMQAAREQWQVLAEAGASVGLPSGVTHPDSHEAGFGEDPFADPFADPTA